MEKQVEEEDNDVDDNEAEEEYMKLKIRAS